MRNYEHGGDIFAGKEKLTDFSVNIDPLGMPASAAEAAQRAVREEVTYPDPFCRKLTAALSERYGVPAENIVCGNGASDLILRLCAAVRPETVLVPAPGFSEYARSAALFGAEIFEYAVPGFDIPDKDGKEKLLPIREAIEQYSPRMVFVCRPNNPDGSLMGTEELWGIASLCKERGALLAVDECFLEFTSATSALAMIGKFSNMAVINAFTKTYSMAGLRLGFMFSADTALLDEVYRFGIPWSVSSAAQAAGAACCAEREFLKDARAYIDRERKRLVSALESSGLKVFPSEANFLLIQDERGFGGASAARGGSGLVPMLTMREKFERRGIKVRDCRSFTGLDDSFIRIGVRTVEENDAFIKALEELYG